MANHRTDTKGATVKVTLVKSPTGFNRTQATVVRSMGLLRIRHTVELKDTPAARGMIHKVRHLVEVDAPAATPASARESAAHAGRQRAGAGPREKVKNNAAQ